MLNLGRLVPYDSWSEVASFDKSFTGSIRVDSETVERLEKTSSTNDFIRKEFDGLKDFDPKKGSLVFDLERWDADMKRISEHPDFWLTSALPLSQVGKSLKAGQIEAFDPARLYSNIKSPPKDFIARFIGAENFRKSKEYYRSNLSLTHKLEKQKETIADLNLQLESTKDRLGSRIDLLISERDEVVEKIKTLIDERDTARSELKAQSKKAKAEAAESLKTFQGRIDALSKDRDELSEKVKAISAERDTARSELKAQSKKAKAEAAESLKTFNARIEDITATRDDLAARLKEAAKVRDDIHVRSKEQTEKLTMRFKADLETLQTQLATAKSERETLSERLKAVSKDREAIGKALEHKNHQIDLQTGQTCFFRAELLRLKGETEKARDMYEKALEKDPDNADYAQKLDLLKQP